MVLESVMLVLDNSEWMRNGDLQPTRMQAELDAANLVLQVKLRANPENGVGVMTMAPKVDVRRSFSTDGARLYIDLHSIKPDGECKLPTAIKVAQMALRHRANRASRCRIVLFLGSPLGDSVQTDELVKIAKKLKKENISADVVLFGETEPTELLNKFVDELNGREGAGSHLVAVASGANLAEALVSSPVCRGEDGAAPPVALAAGGGGFGFDPNEDDPELAMALRVSLEEQRRRQEADAEPAAGAAVPHVAAAHDLSETDAGELAADDDGQQQEAADHAGRPNFDAMTEDEQLDWALRMSMQQSAPAPPAAVVAVESSAPVADATQAPMDTTQAMESDTTPAAGEADSDTALATASAPPPADVDMLDADALQQLVAGLPGVDSNAPVVSKAAKETAKDMNKANKGGDKKDDK